MQDCANVPLFLEGLCTGESKLAPHLISRSDDRLPKASGDRVSTDRMKGSLLKSLLRKQRQETKRDRAPMSSPGLSARNCFNQLGTGLHYRTVNSLSTNIEVGTSDIPFLNIRLHTEF